MQHNIYLYIMVSALVSFAVRAVPLTLIRKKIENPFLKSFLFIASTSLLQNIICYYQTDMKDIGHLCAH